MYVEEGAQDPSFVEEALYCQVENMPHHGGGEGQGCGGRSLWCGGIGVGGEGRVGRRPFEAAVSENCDASFELLFAFGCCCTVAGRIVLGQDCYLEG